MIVMNHIYKFTTRTRGIAFASPVRKYAASTVRQSRKKMPYIIQPSIVLDADNIPVEREIYDAHTTDTLDTKNLLVIGYMAVASSTKHLRGDIERRDLGVIKHAYDQIISDMKKDFTERAELMATRIVSDKDKDILVLNERLLNAQKTSEAAMARIIAEKDAEISNMKDKLAMNDNTIQLMVSKAVTDKEHELSALREQLAIMKASIEREAAVNQERVVASHQRVVELERALQEAKDNAKQSTMDLVKGIRNEEIMNLQAQIAALKGSNFSKGIVGENSVKKWLAEAFIDCEVVDKSGIAAESDLHVVKPNGDFIAVECKNKTQITVQDVEKSIRDISHLKNKYGSRFVGYVFVSLRSTNIPKKGSGTLEIIDDEIPVYWHGQSDFNDEDKSVVEFCKAVMSFASCLRTLRAKFVDTDNAIDTFRKQLTDMMSLFRSCLDRLNQNQKAIASLVSSVKIVQDNNNAALQLLNDYIAANALENMLSISHHNTSHNCSKCGRVFARKGDLTKHMSKCTGDV